MRKARAYLGNQSINDDLTSAYQSYSNNTSESEMHEARSSNWKNRRYDDESRDGWSETDESNSDTGTYWTHRTGQTDRVLYDDAGEPLVMVDEEDGDVETVDDEQFANMDLVRRTPSIVRRGSKAMPSKSIDIDSGVIETVKSARSARTSNTSGKGSKDSHKKPPLGSRTAKQVDNKDDSSKVWTPKKTKKGSKMPFLRKTKTGDSVASRSVKSKAHKYDWDKSEDESTFNPRDIFDQSLKKAAAQPEERMVRNAFVENDHLSYDGTRDSNYARKERTYSDTRDVWKSNSGKKGLSIKPSRSEREDPPQDARDDLSHSYRETLSFHSKSSKRSQRAAGPKKTIITQGESDQVDETEDYTERRDDASSIRRYGTDPEYNISDGSMSGTTGQISIESPPNDSGWFWGALGHLTGNLLGSGTPKHTEQSVPVSEKFQATPKVAKSSSYDSPDAHTTISGKDGMPNTVSDPVSDAVLHTLPSTVSRTESKKIDVEAPETLKDEIIALEEAKSFAKDNQLNDDDASENDPKPKEKLARSNTNDPDNVVAALKHHNDEDDQESSVESATEANGNFSASQKNKGTTSNSQKVLESEAARKKEAESVAASSKQLSSTKSIKSSKKGKKKSGGGGSVGRFLKMKKKRTKDEKSDDPPENAEPIPLNISIAAAAAAKEKETPPLADCKVIPTGEAQSSVASTDPQDEQEQDLDLDVQEEDVEEFMEELHPQGIEAMPNINLRSPKNFVCKCNGFECLEVSWM